MSDPERTTEFVRELTGNARRLYSYILTLMHHDPAADDVFQETSMLAWEKFDQFQAGSDFFAWARRVAYFRVLNYWHSQKRGPQTIGEAFFESVEREMDGMSDQLDAELKALAECYQKLSPKQRDLIDRRYATGAVTREVAEQIGRPLSTVYRMLNQVHEILLRCIERVMQEGRVS